MNFMSRDSWGARSASTSTNITPVGVAVHWEGPHMGTPDHSECGDLVRGFQRFHMDSRGWADIAYSAVVCPHGWVIEGRGRGRRTAANGTNDGNQRFYAVCYLGGEGDPLTDAGKVGILDAIEWLGGGEVIGHRDVTATACPGEELYAWVLAGVPSPVVEPPVVEPPVEPEIPCEEKVFRLGDEGRCVIYIQRLLNKRKGYSLVDDGDFGQKTASAVKKFQRSRKLTADGIVGARTWAALWDGVTL